MTRSNDGGDRSADVMPESSMNTASLERIATAPRSKSATKQDYGAPPAFIEAVERRFGPLTFDLACTRENKKASCGLYFPETDALTVDWSPMPGNLWLNPPFANIEPWAAKLAAECRDRQGFALFLTPASVGSNWFARHVKDNAMVLGLSPRMTFEGETTPYPKDLMLSVFGYGLRGFDTWRWS